ncbi:MAG TPA: hypothetical protein VD962_08625 [Rubricoccaceae bacterium]|nr:hypothetical protein [Rubricoccaceae bacterium]
MPARFCFSAPDETRAPGGAVRAETVSRRGRDQNRCAIAYDGRGTTTRVTQAFTYHRSCHILTDEGAPTFHVGPLRFEEHLGGALVRDGAGRFDGEFEYTMTATFCGLTCEDCDDQAPCTYTFELSGPATVELNVDPAGGGGLWIDRAQVRVHVDNQCPFEADPVEALTLSQDPAVVGLTPDRVGRGGAFVLQDAFLEEPLGTIEIGVGGCGD